jgi:hypothetical protein
MNSDAVYTIRICAVDADKKPVSDLSIEVLLQGSGPPDERLGDEVVTDTGGNARVQFGRSDFTSDITDKGPDVHFRVVWGNTVVSHGLPGGGCQRE